MMQYTCKNSVEITQSEAITVDNETKYFMMQVIMMQNIEIFHRFVLHQFGKLRYIQFHRLK